MINRKHTLPTIYFGKKPNNGRTSQTFLPLKRKLSNIGPSLETPSRLLQYLQCLACELNNVYRKDQRCSQIVYVWHRVQFNWLEPGQGMRPIRPEVDSPNCLRMWIGSKNAASQSNYSLVNL
ncbi:hypothetical protein J6590_048356 [Homalodisca vitripennis]|nr:hypothetical protein J6590_048356 [Homalodisca vitripennis]